MASEYLKWKYKDVKPDPKPVYTKAEMRRNWWNYNWKWVLIAAVCLVALFFLIRDIFFRVEPDYEVALVSKNDFPAEVRQNLKARLEEMGEDLNGDGDVVVDVLVYQLDYDNQGMENIQLTSANATRLTVDLSSGKMYVIITDDPEDFQLRTGALAYLDGSLPSEEDENSKARWREMVYPWEDCPALSGLDLGTYEPIYDPSQELTGQTAMEGFYVGRRVIVNERDEKRLAGADELWLRMTAGAAR